MRSARVRVKSHSKQRIKTAVKQHSVLRKQGMLERLFVTWFNGFVYNQIWEDPKVDAAALELGPESRVLTIGSGGCNVLNYLNYSPAAVTAVDLNPYHMYLTRLKIAAVKHLPSYEDLFRFFGEAESEQNVSDYYQYIRDNLDEATRHFWEGRPFRGVLGQRRIRYFTRNFYNYSRSGTFLRFAHFMARLQKGDPKVVLSAESLEEQTKLFEEYMAPCFDSWIFKKLCRLPVTVYSLGIPPQQFESMRRQNGEDCIVSLLRDRVRRLACDFPVQENYFAWQAFARRYNTDLPECMPDYLRRENFEAIRANIDRVSTNIQDLTEFLKHREPGSVNSFVFLDAQDWMTPEAINHLWRQIDRVGPSGSRVIFRTAGPESPVEEALARDLKNRFVYEESLSRFLHTQDRSAIYGGFHLYRKL